MTRFLRSVFLFLVLSGATLSSSAQALTPLQQLFVFHEVAPDIERVGILFSERVADHDQLMLSIRQAQASTGVKVFVAYAEEVSNVAAQYRTLMRKHDVQALWIPEEIAALADVGRNFLIKESLKQGFPLMAPSEVWVNEGAALHLQSRDGHVHLVANKSVCDAVAITIPDKYTAQTSFLAMN